MDRTLTVLHVSDLQCGAPYLPRAAEAMVGVFDTVQPDLVVASGDLTQRAKVREFELAREVLNRFSGVPVVVTPGNHDVPLYRFWERILIPFRNWRAFAGPDLDTVLRLEGAVVVALNSAAPRRAIINGRIDPDQVAFARRAFADAPPGDRRILVVHHHFVPVPTGEGSHPLPHAERWARAFGEMGVDVVLGGHVHQLHFGSLAGVPFLATGTATSRRGRGVETGWNSLCVHRLVGGRVRVTPYRRAPDADAFEELDMVEFPLGRSGRVARVDEAAEAPMRGGHR
jgi:3',5'-cyclic AMP phosphodiesterase CpdA